MFWENYPVKGSPLSNILTIIGLSLFPSLLPQFAWSRKIFTADWKKKGIPSCKAVSCKDIQVNRHVLKSLPICKSNMCIFLIHTYPKHQNFPGQSISRKRPPLLHKHLQPLFRLMFCSSQLILTSSKWSLEAWCGLFLRWMFYTAQSVRWTFMAL